MDLNFTESLRKGSLPLRERGLKFYGIVNLILFIQSLPSRERGLKLEAEKDYILAFGRSLRGSVD